MNLRRSSLALLLPLLLSLPLMACEADVESRPVEYAPAPATEVTYESEPPPPPAPVVEEVTVSPGPEYVWVPGVHRWNGREYVWMRGHYERRPHHRAHWVPAHWEHRGRMHVWVEGHWG
jgi:hypothetical protein